jgi:hypothetical protein
MMAKVCEICRAPSEPLLEFNKMQACVACFKRRIRLIVGDD